MFNSTCRRLHVAAVRHSIRVLVKNNAADEYEHHPTALHTVYGVW